MEWHEKEIKQCSKPEGELGIDIGKEMNKAHVELWKWSLNYIDLEKEISILDVGCGGGNAINMMVSMFKKSNIVGIDYSKEMVELARKINSENVKQGRIKILNGNVEDLPFEDNSFDLATAFETYYFWPNLIDNLREIKRTLKPGGKLLMANETYKHEKFKERNKEVVKILDIEIHTPCEIKNILNKAGYKGIEIYERVEKNWLTAIAQKSDE